LRPVEDSSKRYAYSGRAEIAQLVGDDALGDLLHSETAFGCERNRHDADRLLKDYLVEVGRPESDSRGMMLTRQRDVFDYPNTRLDSGHPAGTDIPFSAEAKCVGEIAADTGECAYLRNHPARLIAYQQSGRSARGCVLLHASGSGVAAQNIAADRESAR